MARSSVTVASAVLNAATAVTKDAFDIANDHSIDVSNVNTTKLTIYIETLDTHAADFTIKAGDGQAAGIGDLTFSTSAAGLRVITLDSARFKDSDGLILIDIVSSAGATGNIWAVEA